MEMLRIRPPAGTSPESMRDWSWQIVRDFNRLGATQRISTLTRGAAVFGPLMAIVSVLSAIPPTARVLLHDNGSPMSLLGAVIFGWIGFVAIRNLLRVRIATRYLRDHPESP